MKTIVITPQLQRQRKFLLALPVIVLPFLTLFFWSMKAKDGGPKSKESTVLPGLNTHLPGAILKDTGAVDKLSFYEQADAASQKLKQQRQQDPYATQGPDTAIASAPLEFQPANSSIATNDHPQTSPEADRNEQEIYQRLNKLRQAMKQTRTPPEVPAAQSRSFTDRYPHRQHAAQEDPELRQMNNIMEKLVQLQHPETTTPVAGNRTVNKRFRAVRAMVDGKQRITESTVIRMKLMDSVTINGQLFPKGQFVFAAGTFTDQRLKMDIKSIHIGNVIYPVDMTVYDAEDGLEGISVPEAMAGDALRNGASSGIKSMELMSFDPSVTAQLATAGVNTAKGLFSKKVKRIKAKLQDKRALLLRINQPVMTVRSGTK